MLKLDPTISTLSAAGVLAVATSVMLNWGAASIAQQPAAGDSAAALAANATAQVGPWAASATGRVEPKDGEVRLIAQAPGEVVEVVVKANDRVAAGDVLVRLDDADLQSRLEAAESEALVRQRERDEEPQKGLPLERQIAEDAVAAADRAAFKARMALDDAVRKALAAPAGSAANAVKEARAKADEARKTAATERENLAAINAKPGMPLPTRLESSLAVAHTDIAQLETAIDRQRIRAPADGTVLNVWARVGETAMPSADAPLLLFGDLSTLRVRTEVEERDVNKIKLGQKAIVRVDAFPNRDFEGVVTQIAPALGPPRITTRGPRRPNDVEVLEVMITLDGQPPLLTGMRVDAYFKNDSAASASAADGTKQADASSSAKK